MKPRSLNVLPSMQCDVGCGDCCGPVPVSLKRFKQIQVYIRENGILPKEQGETCPLYLDGKCSVYAVRPPICVAYGHSEKLPCSRGYNVNVEEPIVQRVAMSDGPPERLLHELLDDGVRNLTKLDSYPLLRALGRYVNLPSGSVYGTENGGRSQP